MASSIINTDIYDLSGTVNELQKQYMDGESEATRSIGIYGSLNDLHSTSLQNSVIVASEMGNEMWPSRAKFEKNVLAHAITYNIEDINAAPAQMEIRLGLEINTLISLLDSNGRFIIDSMIPISAGGMDFHLPYDIIVERKPIINDEYIYTARYDMSYINPISDITNPYLEAPRLQAIDIGVHLILRCVIQQVSINTLGIKLYTSNPIENKTFEFDFTDQLVLFEVKSVEGDETFILSPFFEGSSIPDDTEYFCYYSYLDEDTIRVRFDSISYIPKVNADISVTIKTTKGAEGNFEYDTSNVQQFTSERFGYRNVSMYIGNPTDSDGGEDRKSIDELRRILPKESLSRGSLSTPQDLQNHFNMLNTDGNRILIQTKTDNQFERSFYAYFAMKDNYDNVVPTNTIDIMINKDTGFDTHVNRKYVLKPGCILGYKRGDAYAIIMEEDELEEFLLDKNHFVYTVPYMTVVTADPLYMSYYLTIMKFVESLIFTYINQSASLQFITTNIIWSRGYTVLPNKYTFDMFVAQNISIDKEIVEYDEDTGKIKAVNVMAVVVFFNISPTDNKDVPYRYSLVTIDPETFVDDKLYTYHLHLELETDDTLNDDSKIRIENVYIPGTTAMDYGYFTQQVKAQVYILAKLDGGIEYGRHDLDGIVPEGLDGWSVTNMYTVQDNFKFYINYSDIVSSTVIDYPVATPEGVMSQNFLIRSVPLVRRSYTAVEENMMTFIDAVNYRKSYVDGAIELLTNNFNIDFKLFNTYGPSVTYSLDIANTQILNRVNMSIDFRIKLATSADAFTVDYIIRDIKAIIEDLNDLTDLHIPNIIAEITNNYRPNSIEFIEYLDFNDYGPGTQHLYRHEYEIVTIVPEFLNVNSNEDGSIDINIHVAR